MPRLLPTCDLPVSDAALVGRRETYTDPRTFRLWVPAGIALAPREVRCSTAMGLTYKGKYSGGAVAIVSKPPLTICSRTRGNGRNKAHGPAVELTPLTVQHGYPASTTVNHWSSGPG